MSEIDKTPWKHDLKRDRMFEKLGSLGQEERVVLLEDEAFPNKLLGDITISDVMGEFYDPSRNRLGPKDWVPGNKGKRRRYTQDDVLLIQKHLRNYPMEAYEELVRDAVHFMVEEAALPNWSDFEYAFDMAKEWVEEKGSINLGLWDPIMQRPMWGDPTMILSSLVHKMKLGKGYVVVFDASNARAVKALEKAYYADPENLSERDMEEGLGEEFKSVMATVVARFWKILEDDVNHFDVWNRANWRKWWREALGDEALVKAARLEFDEILKGEE